MGGGGSDSESGRVSVDLVEAGWPAEVVEPRRADRGGGDVRSGGGAEAAVNSPGAMGHGHRGLRSGFVCAG